jgi:hypothetical protein
MKLRIRSTRREQNLCPGRNLNSSPGSLRSRRLRQGIDSDLTCGRRNDNLSSVHLDWHSDCSMRPVSMYVNACSYA